MIGSMPRRPAREQKDRRRVVRRDLAESRFERSLGDAATGNVSLAHWPTRERHEDKIGLAVAWR
jgi:hypothetical protein